jgi:hypothetical protein
MSTDKPDKWSISFNFTQPYYGFNNGWEYNRMASGQQNPFKPFTDAQKDSLADKLLGMVDGDMEALDNWITEELHKIDQEMEEEVYMEMMELDIIDQLVTEESDLTMAMDLIKKCQKKS